MADNADGTIKSHPALSRAKHLADMGKFDEAARLTIEHLRNHPNEPAGLAQLGHIAMLTGALGQSEHFLRQALAHGSRDFDVRRNLASVVHQRARLDDAEKMFAGLCAEDGDPTLKAVRALILEKLGRNAEALEMQRQLVEDYSDNQYFWISYGHGLRTAGRVDEAVAAYRRAVEIDYECGEAWWGLANIKSKILTDADIVSMQRGLDVAIDIRNSVPMHFAMARAMHDRRRYADAFQHYSRGNSERAESLQYNAQQLTDEVSETIRDVDADFVRRLYRPGSSGPTPVFIVSLPRSGSTLLEQMLGSHEAIEPVGELPYIPAILRSVMEMATRRGKTTVPQIIASISDDDADAMGRDYLHRASLHRNTERPFFVDKLPHNWSNTLFIKRILPNAKFVDIRRDPMDCCFANFTQAFSSAHAASFALEHVAQCYVDYVRFMTHLDQVAPTMVHHISYASLLDNAEQELRAALSYLGLDWDPSVLEFHKLDRAVRTPSSEQVRRPLNRDGVAVWKPYSEWLGPLREALGPLATS